MKNAIYPLNLDAGLHSEVKAAAKVTGLSQAETMRQAMRAGLDRVKSKLVRSHRRANLFESLRSLGPVKIKRR
jgi:hypothetical protein